MIEKNYWGNLFVFKDLFYLKSGKFRNYNYFGNIIGRRLKAEHTAPIAIYNSKAFKPARTTFTA